ncbi:hypothetical protein Tco_0763852 [Tanacetum coccineum]
MPESIQVDHQDTAFYIPKYHGIDGLSDDEKTIYKNLERRYIHEGHVVHPSYLDDQPNLRQIFSAIRFDCLLDIDEQICPVFVLQFYKSFRLVHNLDETLSIACVCIFSTEWSIASLSNSNVPNPNYLPPIENAQTIRDAFFYERPPGTTRKETILSENAMSFSGNKDHSNACLAYMLYCLSIQKPFNLAYYIAKWMESVTRSDVMVLPYGMLLTRLYEHVLTSHPFAISDLQYLASHVMIHLTEGKTRRIMVKGKRPHPQTLSKSSSSPSPTPNQEENDPVDNYTLDPIVYMNQLPPIKGGESSEFKQTKGMKFEILGTFDAYVVPSAAKADSILEMEPSLPVLHASSSIKNPPRKLARTNVIDISSPLQQNNLIPITLNTTLALSITPPMTSQTPPTQPIEVSPLASQSPRILNSTKLTHRASSLFELLG